MRTQILINKKFQLTFILFMAALALITLAASYLILQGYFTDFIKMADDSGLANNHPFRGLIAYQQNKMNQWFLVIGITNFTIIFISGIWMSHRIAGPIHRIVSSLKFKKDDAPITIRKGDFFQELPQAINSYLDMH